MKRNIERHYAITGKLNARFFIVLLTRLKKEWQSSFDRVLMLNVLVLQKSHDLNDEATEEQIFDMCHFRVAAS
jgi:hypothetical protein